MRAVILHSPVDDEAPPDEQDVLVQAEFVASSLVQMGWEAHVLPFGLDLERVRLDLGRLRPDVVVNLVETVMGTGRLIHLAPSLLDLEGIPYTGSPTEAVFLTSNKVLTKRLLATWNLPTPEAIFSENERASLEPGARYIVKSVWEDGSVGISQGSVVVLQDAEGLREAFTRGRGAANGGEVFAERFIDGREFNLSLLSGPSGVEVLPVSEMRFEGFGPERARIVDYEAKWSIGSFAQCHTIRSFSFPPRDEPLLARLRELARICWDRFGVRGYGRVDFRVDGEGKPWILEINANPCIAPDAGFMAAAREAGLDAEDVIRRILGDSLGWSHHRGK